MTPTPEPEVEASVRLKRLMPLCLALQRLVKDAGINDAEAIHLCLAHCVMIARTYEAIGIVSGPDGKSWKQCLKDAVDSLFEVTVPDSFGAAVLKMLEDTK